MLHACSYIDPATHAFSVRLPARPSGLRASQDRPGSQSVPCARSSARWLERAVSLPLDMVAIEEVAPGPGGPGRHRQPLKDGA